jgi:hypothetical protein
MLKATRLEQLIADLYEAGIIDIFQGINGSNPMSLSGAETDKLWLKAYDNPEHGGEDNSHGQLLYYTGGDATNEDNWAELTPQTFAAHINNVVGGYQPLDADLTAIAALATTDGNVIVGDGSTWVAESGATARTSLGLGTGNSPQFTAIELGHASANTLTASSGHMTIEGATVWDSGNDGAGSGLDADLLDGQSSAYYATATSVSDHLADTADAHDASAISVLDSGTNYTATDVEAALAEVMDALQAHEADSAGAHAATAISFSPEGTIAATTVQAAIQEVRDEAQPLDSDLTSWAGVTRASGFDTFAATSSSANLASLVTDETGTGALVFGTGPSIAGATLTGVLDAGGADSLELPNSAAPTVNVDGEIALDTTVTDFSHGIVKYYGGEEMAVIAVPVAQLGSPTNNYAVMYDSTADEFQLKDPAGAAGATTALNNLASVAINTSLVSDTDNTDSLGSTAIRWANVHALQFNDGQQAGFRNALINGAMMMSQRGTSFTDALPAAGGNNDDTYNLDRWVLLSDGNDIVDVSQDTADVPTGGLYAAKCLVVTVNKKFGLLQIIEQKNCIGLIGNTVTLSFKAKVNNTTRLDKIKAGIISWSSTADTVTSDIISAWGTDGTTPTLVANWTFENTPADLGVTTSWASYSVSATVDTASTKNIAVFIWSDNVTDTDAADTFAITDVQLEIGSTATTFERRHSQLELKLCERYCEMFLAGYTGDVTSGNDYGVIASWKVQKFASPTLTHVEDVDQAGFNTGTPTTNSFTVYGGRLTKQATTTAGGRLWISRDLIISEM